MTKEGEAIVKRFMRKSFVTVDTVTEFAPSIFLGPFAQKANDGSEYGAMAFQDWSAWQGGSNEQQYLNGTLVEGRCYRPVASAKGVAFEEAPEGDPPF